MRAHPVRANRSAAAGQALPGTAVRAQLNRSRSGCSPPKSKPGHGGGGGRALRASDVAAVCFERDPAGGAPATLLGDDTPVRASERTDSGGGVGQMLSGGAPRSLHGVDQVIAAVLAEPSALEALFECLFCDDSVVRMRAGDALEKIARIRPELLAPFARRLLSDVADVDQPSIQWHARYQRSPRRWPACGSSSAPTGRSRSSS